MRKDALRTKDGLPQTACEYCGKLMGEYIGPFCTKTCHLNWQRNHHVADLRKIRALKTLARGKGEAS